MSGTKAVISRYDGICMKQKQSDQGNRHFSNIKHEKNINVAESRILSRINP